MSGRDISYKGQHIKVDDRNVDDVESRTQKFNACAEVSLNFV